MKTPKRINGGKYSGFKDVTREWLEHQHFTTFTIDSKKLVIDFI